MLNIAVFGATVSYVLMMLAHIVLRSREPDLERGYRTPGGTATSGVALVLALLAVVATFLVDEKAALITLGVYAAAAAYFYFYSRHHLVSSAPEEEFAAITSAESELQGVNVEQLKRAVGDGSIDTVLLVFADMQGRLQGKRLVGKHFVEEVLEHDAEACNYLLAVDVDMNTVEGYTMSSWSHGLRRLRDEAATWRRCARSPGTRRPRCAWPTSLWHDESPVVASPRQILRGQLDRLAERGWSALAATELEFIVFRDTYEEAFDKGYKDLVPGNQYNVDYSILGTSRLEPLLGRIRREMAAAGLEVENSKGECNFGQHEINFTYEDALGAADTHAIYKNGAKEIASQEGMAITFMAKYDEREGNSCHIHLSLRGEDDTPVFADQPELFDRFLAGQLACLRELTLFLAPNINSYKRFAEGSFAPTAVAWGRDNRTCSMRVIGHGPALRIESRVAGRRRQPLPRDRGDDRRRGCTGSTTSSSSSRRSRATRTRPTSRTCRARCRRRATCSPASDVAREAFGEDVVAHYLNNADVELRAFEAAVTDWERFAGLRAAVTLDGPRARHRGGARGDPARGRRRRPTPRSRAPRRRIPAWRAVAPARPRRAAAPARRRARRASTRTLARARGAQRRQADRRRARRDGDGRRHLPLLRGRRRSGCSATRSRWPAASAMTVPRAARRRRR